MRTMKIWSVAVALLGAVLLSDGANAQRVRPEAISRTPSLVEVTNFPAVQAVSGTVNVGNLPAVQSVQVQNFPLDKHLHVVGITTAVIAQSGSRPPGVLLLSRLCAAEFPNSRTCGLEEAFQSIPTAPDWSDSVWIVERFDNGNTQCYTSDGIGAPCKLEVSDPGTHSVLCCGF